MAIGLQTMSQSRLHNSFAALNLRQQAMHIGHNFIINFTKMLGNNATQQQTTKTRRVLNWQVQCTDRQATRRRKRPSVPNLYFSKHFASNHDFRD
jgi:hypothetical protein